MKKLLVTLCLATGTTFVHAQGYIEYVGAAANIQTNTAVGTFFGGTGTGGTFGKLAGFSATSPIYDFMLLYAITTISGNSAPTNSAWSPVLAYGGGNLPLGTNWLDPGTMFGPGSVGGVQVNLAPETAYSVELVGWDASMGTYSDMLPIISSGEPYDSPFGSAGYLGWTSVGTITPQSTLGADPALFPQAFSNGTMTLNLISPFPTPEPTTIALAGLGGLALLGLRRKK